MVLSYYRRKTGGKKNGHASGYNLFIIHALTLILPLLTVSYIFYKSSISLNNSQVFILAFTLALILCGLYIMRQIFDRLLKITSFIKTAENGEVLSESTKRNTLELQELTESFEKLMKNFNDTTEELKTRVFELFTIKELTELASKSLSMDSMLVTLLEKSMAVSKAQIGSIFILDEEKKQFRVVASIGSEYGPKKGTYVKIEDSLMEYVAVHKKPLLVEDIKNDPRTRKVNDSRYGAPSFLSMPIMVRDELIAVLNLANKESGQIFDPNDNQILSIMLGEIGFALENAMLHSEVEQHLKDLQNRTRQLINTNAQLHKEIANRKRVSKEKEALKAELVRSQKMEAIGTLAGGIAHDLNNVLSGIVSYPDLLVKQLPEDSPFRKPILTIQDSGKKAAAIVQDMLTLARRGVSIKETVHLNDVISEYLTSPEHEKLKSFHPGVKVVTKLDANLMNIVGSHIRLFQVIMNLVSNATEAIHEDGLLNISTENRYVDSPIGGYEKIAEGEYIVLTISDNGTGISPEDLEKIFDPFYTKKVMGRSGTGLGMAVVWGTVKDHGGYVDVRSSVGNGTTFSIFLPATRQKTTTVEDTLPMASYEGRGESILVVDDIEKQREIASELLQNLGYSVTAASSGEEAVEYLKENSADLVLLDMIMDPGIDGLETYRQIIEFNPDQRAVIASGFSETERVKEAQKLGVGQYIMKPYTLQKMGVVLKNELGREHQNLGSV
jgi:signal transduction histidine kinase/CheY-like chemotaxis protein